MNKNTLLLLSFATFITVVAWIGFSIHHNLTTSTISETENLQIIPIDPSFDTQTIQSLMERTKINPIFEIDPASVPSSEESSEGATLATPTPQQEIPVATQSSRIIGT